MVEKTQGMLLFLVRILGMGLSSARKAGDVTVALLANNVKIPECTGFLTNDRLRKRDNFDILFEVTEETIINFVRKANSSDMLCTTVSLIMEILK